MSLPILKLEVMVERSIVIISMVRVVIIRGESDVKGVEIMGIE